MKPSAYGEAFAAVYDEWYPADSSVGTIVGALEDLADGGPVLELGVGTGRVALPLAARGIDVWGVDASPAMLARLAEKDRARSIKTVLCDIADLTLPSNAPRFAVVVSVFNTFFLLTTEAAQRACLRRCHAALALRGRLVLELYSPAPAAPGHEEWEDTIAGPAGDRIGRRYRRDPHDERVLVGETGGRPWALRPLPVTELDAMAADCGFTLEHRWATWSRNPYFGARSTHVSVWRSREWRPHGQDERHQADVSGLPRRA